MGAGVLNMNRQVFLVRVDPEQWAFKGKKKDWGNIDEGDWVPFGPLFEQGMKKGDYIEYKEHIDQTRIKDIIIGYSCYEKKYVEALGRIVSNRFDYINEKTFLIQKTTQLKNPIHREMIKDILESDSKLKVNQPTVTLVKNDDWEKIKKIILEKNPELSEDINKLVAGRDDWQD